MSKVLLVEDADDLAQVITREFESSGYIVLHAGDGETVLKLHQLINQMSLSWIGCCQV